MESEKSYHLWAERWTQQYADIVTVNCTALKDFAVRSVGIPEGKIVLIPNGIEVPAVLPASPKNGAPRIGTLGRLHSQKAVDVFLKAAQKISARRPDCRFVIGGEGPEENNLKTLARELGIQERVEFAGLVADPAQFLSQLDVFVLASRWEGMPNVILEAMARKVPVVATAVGGTTDLIRDGREGLLVLPEDPDALAEAALRLIDSPELKMQFSEAAYKRVGSEFSMEIMIERYRKFYESLAA
jgi:glycosyltransferase involved in cell wall biosynthesis